MFDINEFEETLKLCFGAHFNKDVKGWETLSEFDKYISNPDFNAKVYKKGNKVVIAFAGSDTKREDDLKNSINFILFPYKIPSQYEEAEYLYTKVANKYHNIEFVGYKTKSNKIRTKNAEEIIPNPKRIL